MAAVFFAWELGEGLGHLTRMKPLMNYLAARGHSLTLAARDLANVHGVLGDLKPTVLQAPVCRKKLSEAEWRTASFGEMLRNVGYHDAVGLTTMIAAWTNLLTIRRPALVVADHSPTALLAARTLGCRTAVLASGFVHPPASRPIGVFKPDLDDLERGLLMASDDRLKDNVNQALGGRAIDEVADIYAAIDDVYLYTVPEFDHFGAREHAEYCGPVEGTAGTTRPQWPRANAPKVYAYLKFHSRLQELLDSFAQARMNLLMYCNDVPSDLIERYRSTSLRFSDRPLNLTAVAKQADLGIVNANHGTTFQLLKRVLPLVLVPLQVEQRLLCARLHETGAVATASMNQPQSVIAVANAMITDDRYRQAAAAFSDRISRTDWAAQQRIIYERIAADLEAV